MNFSVESCDETDEPVVHTHNTALTREETYRLSPEQLWETLGRELLSSKIGDRKVKYIAFLSSTRYHTTVLYTSLYNCSGTTTPGGSSR